MKPSFPNFKVFSNLSVVIISLTVLLFFYSSFRYLSERRHFLEENYQDISSLLQSLISQASLCGEDSVKAGSIDPCMLEKLEQYKGMTRVQFTALFLNDSLIFSTNLPSCVKNEINYASLASDSLRFFNCKEEDLLKKYCWIKTNLHDELILLSVFPVREKNKLFLYLIYFSFLLVILMAFLIPYWYKQQVQSQLRRINDVLERISNKDFDAYIAPDYPGVMGELIQSVNRMRIQLKEIYHDLEIRVIRRTSEISMRNAELRKTQREILKQNHELKSAYEALKESRDKYEQLIEHLEDEYFFYSKALNGTLLFVSPSVKRILGYDISEYRKIHAKIYTSSPINARADKIEEKIRRAESQPKYLREVYTREKEVKTLEISEVAVYSEEGKLVTIEGLAHDITEQHKAQDLIREQEEKYRMLFTNASDFIMMYELDRKNKKVGNIIEANHYTLEKLGYSLDELRKMTPLDLQAVEVWKEEETEIIELANSESTFDRIWESKTGTILDVEISVHSLKINSRDVAIAVARDITERKKAEEEVRFVNEELINQKENLEALVDNLTQTQEQLVQSEKMAALGQLIAGIAHEINTPLGAIKASIGNLDDSLQVALSELPSLFQTQSLDNLKLFTEIFELANTKKPELSSREKRQNRREIASKLREQDIPDADLIADTLVYLEIYSGSVDQLIPSLNMPDALKVIRSAKNFISLLKNTNTINIAVEKATKVVFALKKYAHRDAIGEKVSTDLIDNIETVLTLYHNQLKQGIEVDKQYEKLPLVQCYQDEMSQVWTNLIQNAIQAMRQEGTLTIKTHAHGEYVFISFQDTGTGIEPDIIDKIFDPFFTTKKQGEGSGLGLDIVKKIIEKHNGTITVESNLGEGAKFIIKLPIA